MQTETNDGEDYIKALPDDVLCNILSLLELREAVRTSCLSSRWRHLSAYLSKLELNRRNMVSDSNQLEQLDVELGKLYSNCSRVSFKFVEAVNQYLEFHKGPHVRTFRLISCLSRSSHATHIDRWVSFALNRGVIDLYIDFKCTDIGRKDDRNLDDYYVFRAGLGESRLERLSLTSCVVGPSAISQFSDSLVSLRLHRVDISREGELCNICSTCVKLDFLSVSGCKLPARVCISSRSLETLILDCCKGAAEIQISAPKLYTFQFMCYTGSFSFFSVPKFESMLIVDQHSLSHYIFTQLARYVPALKELTLRTELPTDGIRITQFSQVAQLNIRIREMVEFDVKKVIRILKAFPLLKELDLTTCCPKPSEQQDGDTESITGADEIDGVLKHLKIVAIRGFYGTRDQIRFATYLLKHAVSLELLHIIPRVPFFSFHQRDSKLWRKTWDAGERQEVCLALQDFSDDPRLLIET